VDQEAISVTSNFFELGGHSLRATALINKINRKFGVTIPLKDIFIKQTIKQQSEIIDTNDWLFSEKNGSEDKVKFTI
jgi:acyl carrier protein